MKIRNSEKKKKENEISNKIKGFFVDGSCDASFTPTQAQRQTQLCVRLHLLASYRQ